HGHLNIPETHRTTAGHRLGNWIAARRRERRKGKLNPERVAALDALGMVWQVHDERFARYLAAARDYHAEHGHLNVPHDHRTPAGHQLGTWIAKRRSEHRRGALSPERVAALDKLGMIWETCDDGFARSLAAARAFHTEHGHLAPIRRSASAEHRKLAEWLGIQRKKQRRGDLPPERAAALRDIDPLWEQPYLSRGLAAARAF
ncbi:MAG: hypothetical protein GEV09_27430, partial [Pseudonocardiaceae bacterium]|nr:hypothetical protein [Pseudonocardiaceae bacterium]